jgi:hypothetical protein
MMGASDPLQEVRLRLAQRVVKLVAAGLHGCAKTAPSCLSPNPLLGYAATTAAMSLLR